MYGPEKKKNSTQQKRQKLFPIGVFDVSTTYNKDIQSMVVISKGKSSTWNWVVLDFVGLHCLHPWCTIRVDPIKLTAEISENEISNILSVNSTLVYFGLPFKHAHIHTDC